MTERPRHPISDELEPYVDEAEAEPMDRLAERLADERATPGPSFRAGLRAALEDRAREAPREDEQPDPRFVPAPACSRATVAAYAGAGLILLGVAALGLAGAGPLAA